MNTNIMNITAMDTTRQHIFGFVLAAVVGILLSFFRAIRPNNNSLSNPTAEEDLVPYIGQPMPFREPNGKVWYFPFPYEFSITTQARRCHLPKSLPVMDAIAARVANISLTDHAGPVVL